MISLDSHIDSLLDSYGTHEMVNHSGHWNLPSRTSIENILTGLDSLLFPGFRETSELNQNNLKLVTSEKAFRLARQLIREIEKSLTFAARSGEINCESENCHDEAERLVEGFFAKLPDLRRILSLDLQANFRGDPAAKFVEEIILSYPGFQAVVVNRLAHYFYLAAVPLIPRMMSEIAHGRTGIDIHPGAHLGEAIFIDHGTGVVIGETTVIGKNVKIFQGVTLGALSVKKGESNRKRHPTIEDDVTIYSNATILGGETVIGKGSVIGGNVWITESVPPGSKIRLGG
ncbi:MAG: serine acetyltransferase [Treponema sp.]|jgi:serine O-acetyltransferase|nr:serine acetyltransferase [Treponema sp.]